MTKIQYTGINYLMENELNNILLKITVHLKDINSFYIIEGNVYIDTEKSGNFVYTENDNTFNKVISDCLIKDKNKISNFIDETIDEIKEYLNSDEHQNFIKQYIDKEENQQEV